MSETAGDGEHLASILLVFGATGRTLDELIVATGWTHRRATDALLALQPRTVGHRLDRERGLKLRRYYIKSEHP